MAPDLRKVIVTWPDLSAAVRSRISSNWLLSQISSSVVSAPRVYLEFEILRDGAERTIKLLGCSSIAALDRSYVDVPTHWRTS